MTTLKMVERTARKVFFKSLWKFLDVKKPSDLIFPALFAAAVIVVTVIASK